MPCTGDIAAFAPGYGVVQRSFDLPGFFSRNQSTSSSRRWGRLPGVWRENVPRGCAGPVRRARRVESKVATGEAVDLSSGVASPAKSGGKGVVTENGTAPVEAYTVSEQVSSRNKALVENVVIVGSGPAGYTAATYAGRANLKPVLLEGMQSGVPGGQLMTTDEVENFPGFPDGITGPELMANMRAQAERWGTEMVQDDCLEIDLDERPFKVKTASSGTYLAHAVIIATGASARRLNIPGEHTFWSRGISACAICDGAAPIFAGVDLAVVGGGDSACEEAVYLCKYAKHVHLLVRGNMLRASKTLCDRVMNHPSITVHFHTAATEALGGAQSGSGAGSPLRAVRVRNTVTGEERKLQVRGLFYAIGHTPNTGFLRGDKADSLLRLDKSGHILTKQVGAPQTHIDGLFAAGDVMDAQWRQAVTAAGSGCMAAIAAERFLTERSLGVEYHDAANTALAPSPSSIEQQASGSEKEAEARGADNEESYNIEDTWHRGQFALRKLYHESKRPLIVKYISPGCGPCRQLKPILHAVVRSMESKVHFCEIDITVDQDIAEAAGVTGSPTVHIFHEKSLIKELKGVRMKSEYRRIVDETLEKTTASVR